MLSVSELIEELQKLKNNGHGNKPVRDTDGNPVISTSIGQTRDLNEFAVFIEAEF